jgi:hypothetical protein
MGTYSFYVTRKLLDAAGADLSPGYVPDKPLEHFPWAHLNEA